MPPPPAPTASDANPWTMTGERRPKFVPWARAPLPLPRERTPREAAQVPQSQPSSPLRFVPLLVFGGIFVMVVLTALEAIRAGAPLSAIGPLLVVAVVMVAAVRGMLRRRR